MSKTISKHRPNHPTKFTLGANVLKDVQSFSASVDASIVELRTRLHAPEGALINPPVIVSDEQKTVADHWELFFAQQVQGMMHEILGVTPAQDTKCYSDTPESTDEPNLGADQLPQGGELDLNSLLAQLQGEAGAMDAEGASDDGVNYEADRAAEG